MTMRAGVYARISDDRRGGAGLGVQRQVEDCQALAERLGWPVAGVYVDNDVSAYSGKPRKDYQRLLADIRAGHITSVLAWHTDRLHRSPVELEEYMSVCELRAAITHT
jgi:site-specific DNA recombinase